ncbi:phosphoribosylformylglycinamidine synthase subunit PurS [Dellaglioa sp. P0083]|uniref:phosphoribosylformylglycinamidine synthase subunit PurS n=1 Tax=Dellaglioa kimchii TaxID=3344667 RepID=UPI0038D455A4
MYSVKVYVTYKESVLDPQGQAVNEAINRLGFSGVSDVRVGKYFVLKVEATELEIDQKIDAICDKLLANPNMEQYRYELEKVEA